MEFTCGHCGKLINCSAIIVDGTFLHATCKEEYKRRKIYAKWEKTGLLDGLKGQLNDDISRLYECCKSTPINE